MSIADVLAEWSKLLRRMNDPRCWVEEVKVGASGKKALRLHDPASVRP